MRRIPRARAAGVALLAALTAVLGLAVTPASAAITTVSGSALSQPTVTAGQAGPQAAGNLTPTVTGAIVSGDNLRISVDDSDGAANCSGGAADAIGFSGSPSVTATVTSGTAPSFSTALSSSASCGAVSVTDVFTITFTSSYTGDVAFTISGINYTVGSGVSAGPVAVVMAGFNAGSAVAASTDAGGDNSNATVINLVTSSPNPTSIPAGTTTATAAGNIVVTELGPTAMPTGDVCFVLISGNATFDLAGTAPTVAASGGDTVTTPAGRTATTLTTTIGGGATNTSTFTVANIRVIPGVGASGPVRVELRESTCTTPLSNSVVIASILTTVRYAGFDRYATGEVIASNTPTFGAITPNCNAIIARGDLFPDALAGSYLAGKLNAAVAGGIMQLGYAPILLTPPDSLSPNTLNALRNLRVKQVFILGGTAAVSQAVADQIAATATQAGVGTCGIPATGPTGNILVERIAGIDRYETARRVAERPGLALAGTVDIDDDATAGAAENLRTAMVTTGENFPDALSGGPLAVRGSTGANTNEGGGFPLLLTDQASLNSSAAAALTNLGIRQVVVIGGTAAVSDAVVTGIQSLGITVVRKAGADRAATAVAVATMARASGTAAAAGEQGLNWAFAPAGGSNVINLARGDAFPDSLTGGPHSGIEFGPIVLAENPNTLGTATTNYLKAVGGALTGTPVSTLHIFGGTAAISNATATAAQNALAGA